MAHRVRLILAAVFGAVVLAVAVVLLFLFVRVAGYVDPWESRVAEAGYVHKTAHINQISLSYVEGPDNGPPLVLLHAQLLDWFSYSRVLPVLSRSFHVFAVDYPGHGQTRTPANYPMTASQIGADLGLFIKEQIGKPVYLSGNSSGGLLAVWLAANRPELVKAVVLEDPPLFSSEYPRIKQTIADRAFKTSHAAMQDHPKDFLLYWIHSNSLFFSRHIGPGTPFLLSGAVRVYRWANPHKPVDIGLLGNDTVRMLVRGLDQYDPRFGAAFYEGTWNQGFDHAEALRKITCPTLLLQANSAILPDGTLDGAMSKADADHAMSLLRHGQYLKVDASHVINLDKPDIFISTLEAFFRQQGS